MKASRFSSFIESQLFFCCFLLSDIHLVFGSSIPYGELMHFLTQCGQFALTCRGSPGHIGPAPAGYSLTSFVSQHDYRVDAHCPTSRDGAGRKRNTAQ
jgi:hypothetical protein